MLRAIVGWVAVDGNDWRGNDWRGTMRRVNDKVKNVLFFFPVGRWSDALFKRQFRLATRIASSISRPGFATLWALLSIGAAISIQGHSAHLNAHSKDGTIWFRNFVTIAMVILFGLNMLVTL